MRSVARLGSAGFVIAIVAIVAAGCGSDQSTGLAIGGAGSGAQTTFSATTSDNLTQYVLVNGPGLGSGNNTTASVTITTWLVNNTEASITASIRKCALLSDDLITVDSMALFGPSQADCGADTVQTVTLAPFAQTGTLQGTFPWIAPAGDYQVGVRLILQPAYWLTVDIGDG
jgi:hypothetical protein